MRATALGCIFFAMCPSLTACASIFSGSSKDVDVQVPPGALVEIAKMKSSAPVYRGRGGKVRLDTGYGYLVTVKNPGRLPGEPSQEDLIFPIDRRIDGATFLNILWVIPIFIGAGVGIDMATGAFWTLPGHVSASWPVMPLPPPPPVAPPPPVVPAPIQDAPATM